MHVRILSRLLFVLSLLTTGMALVTPLSAAERLNVVYILADDLGWTDLSHQGSKFYETPHIDRLASEGMRFTNYHNSQNCQPTRAALMTGQYAARTGVYTVGGIDRFNWQKRPLRPVDNVNKLPLEKVTIAQVLKSAGYRTGMFGKWHLGNEPDYHPSSRGFEEALVSEGKHFDFSTNPQVPVEPGTYLADFLTERALDFIDRHQQEPFFLYLPHFGVHSPHQAKESWIAHFKDKPAHGGHHNPVYAAMIASVDESVGRVLEQLERLKLSDRTVVIFSSDNGGVGGYVREGLKRSGDITDNAPLRSGKGSLYEGGIRVPFIVRWPQVVRGGGVCDQPTIHVDVFPTLLEVTGVEAPQDQPLDGESLVKLMRNPDAKLQREAIFQHFPGYLGAGEDTWRTTPVGLMHMGPWKLMEFFEDGRLELYNLADDVGERNNLAEREPERVKAMHAQMVAWRERVGAPMPQPNVGTAQTRLDDQGESQKRKRRRK